MGLLFASKSSKTIDFLSRLCYNENVAWPAMQINLEGEVTMYDISMWLIDLSVAFFLSALIMIMIKAYTKNARKIKQAAVSSTIKIPVGALLFALAKALEDVPTAVKQQFNDSTPIKWLILLTLFALIAEILLAYRKIIVANKKKNRKPHYSPRPQP